MVSVVSCDACWSNLTRLLKIDMNGTTVASAASSWIEGPGGLAYSWAFRMPPDFCAAAPPMGAVTASRAPASTPKAGLVRIVHPLLFLLIGRLPGRACALPPAVNAPFRSDERRVG